MFNWLQKIRNEPVSKRRLIAFGTSLLITGIIFVMWISVWLPNFFQTSTVTEKNNQQFESPKDSFVQSISTAWSAVGSEYSDLKNAMTGVSLSPSVQYQSTTTTETPASKYTFSY